MAKSVGVQLKFVAKNVVFCLKFVAKSVYLQIFSEVLSLICSRLWKGK